MGASNKSGAAGLLDGAHAQLSGQARVNAEIYTAMEILGRKLERSESERDRLARRLALIESAATVDEKTGRLYLPVAVEQAQAARAVEYAAPRWMVAVSFMSSAVALFALGLVLFRDPPPMALSQEQLAVLDSLAGSRFAAMAPDSGGWRRLAGEEPEEKARALPGSDELAMMEKTAELPKPVVEAPVEVPVVAAVPPTPPEAAAEKGAEAKVAEAVPTDISIPGEDMPAAPEPVAKKEPATAETASQAAETKREPAPAGDPASDTTLPEKLAALEKRAYQGIPEAQHDLATVYASGKMVAQDYGRAIYWFTKSAEGGVGNAHYNLGVIYQQGLGVAPDMQKAIGWYEKAAELGHPEAMYNLGIAYIEGIGTALNVEKGVSYFKRAAKAGVAQAAYNLGVLYESNFIGRIDKAAALEWYQMASAQGHADAREAMNRLSGAEDQALTLAEMTEPAAGEEEYGEGDSSPVSERRRPVSSGSKQDVLADIQQELIGRGLLPGPADGMMNAQTEDAIRSYQKKLGMTEDGLPSRALLDGIRESSRQ